MRSDTFYKRTFFVLYKFTTTYYINYTFNNGGQLWLLTSEQKTTIAVQRPVLIVVALTLSHHVLRYLKMPRTVRKSDSHKEHSKKTMLCSGSRRKPRPKRKDPKPKENVATARVKDTVVEIAK